MKSRFRFALALTLAVLLGGWLIWTSIGGSIETYTSPSGLMTTANGTTYRLNGTVGPGAPVDAAERAQSAAGVRFVVRDKDRPAASVVVAYRGSVPDAFTVGREIVVTGHMESGVFVADRGTLITLCPSKFMQEQADQGATMPGGTPAESPGT
ncbi:MAG: cytochrome c maturation protein CcmE [Thermoleophilia bacterium]|nr:cytochrome c maturation protein CcmE [Thermoleophilia bacterium]